MYFCTECDNMYYLKITENDANTLIYYCRNCGNENTTLTADNVCVSDTHIKQTEGQFTHIVNEYTKYDPTLPRINTIDCPNIKCESNKEKEDKTNKEIIYIRYDDTNMKYMYVCAVCDTTWKN